jgi:hypothetical protein
MASVAAYEADIELLIHHPLLFGIGINQRDRVAIRGKAPSEVATHFAGSHDDVSLVLHALYLDFPGPAELG